MSRWKAAAIHLSISAAIGITSAVLIFLVWYPPPYGRAADAGQLVKLLLGVDVVLGPVLTLVVFKSGKKSLRFDLGVIAILQACAFAYGMSIVVRARPVFIVAAVNKFSAIVASDIDAADLRKGSKAEFRSLPWTGPRLVGAAPPADNETRMKVFGGGFNGKRLEELPQFYVDYEERKATIAKFARPLSDLLAKAEARPRCEAWLREHTREAEDVIYMPMMTAREYLTVLLDKRTTDVLDVLPIDPD